MQDQEILAEIQAGKISSIYLLSGPENHIKHEIISALKKKILTDNTLLNFNYNTFYGPEFDAKEFLTVCETIPFISNRRLVVLYNLDKLTKSQLNAIRDYVLAPCEFTTLVLLADDVNFKITLHHSAKQIKCWKPFKNYAIKWIIDKMKTYNKTITYQAADYLYTIFGGNIEQIDSEISKLINYISGKKDFTIVDIEKLRSSFLDTTPFELANAAGEKNKLKMFSIFERLYNKKEPLIKILGVMAGHFRLLLQMKILLTEEHLSKETAGEKLGIGEKKLQLNAIYSQQQFHSIESLKRSIGLFAKMDEILKSTDERLHKFQFENMLLELVGF